MGDCMIDSDGGDQQYSLMNVDPNIKSCNEHHDMYLHKDDTLIKPGDMFDTHESFRLYVNGYAEQWLYYYTCADSHTQDPSKESYTYRCVYCKPKCHYQPKGIRRRAETLKTCCPCKIVLKRLPYNPDLLTVEFVCDHHNHELSNESFLKLQHGKRIHPQVKEEIMDLLYLDLEGKILKQYIHKLTGLNLSINYFTHIARKMIKNNVERTFTQEKLEELSKKIKDLRYMYGNSKDNQDSDSPTKPQRGRRKRKYEGENVSDSQDINQIEEFGTPYSPDKKSKRRSDVTEHKEVNRKSRLETCLQRLSYDEETLESVKKLQSSVQCETQRNPWISDEICPAPSNGTSYITETSETIQNELQNAINEDTNDYQTEHIDNNYIQNIGEHNVEVAEINNSDDQIIADNFVLDGNEHNASESYVLENSEHNVSETYVLEGNEHNAVNYVLAANEHNIPQSYVLENGIVVTYNGDGQGFTESEVVYDNDHTVVANEQQGESNNYVLMEDNTNVDNNAEQNEDNVESHDNNISTSNIVSDVSTRSEYEYIHRFNIDQYMIQPWFPKYIQRVADDTKIKVVDMLSDLYLGKTMFKLITTRKLNMQTIRITYMVDNVPSLSGFDSNDRIKYKMEATKYCKKLMSLKRKLSESSKYIHGLRGTVDSLKKANSGLASRNKYLERIKSQNGQHNSDVNKKDLQQLRETKESLLSQISDSEHQIAQLIEVKKNLKTDICKFISKKVLLKEMSGESTDKLEDIKSTLTKAIETSKSLLVDNGEVNNQANMEQYVIGNLEGLENIVMAVENVGDGDIDAQYNEGNIVYVVQGDQDEINLQAMS
ncbi:uncharacterized protein ACR2FA_012201 [Aphomia sociella]